MLRAARGRCVRPRAAPTRIRARPGPARPGEWGHPTDAVASRARQSRAGGLLALAWVCRRRWFPEVSVRPFPGLEYHACGRVTANALVKGHQAALAAGCRHRRRLPGSRARGRSSGFWVPEWVISPTRRRAAPGQTCASWTAPEGTTGRGYRARCRERSSLRQRAVVRPESALPVSALAAEAVRSPPARSLMSQAPRCSHMRS